MSSFYCILFFSRNEIQAVCFCKKIIEYYDIVVFVKGNSIYVCFFRRESICYINPRNYIMALINNKEKFKT